jgi:16S rRNA (guanine1516-N2)-methyltransferase
VGVILLPEADAATLTIEEAELLATVGVEVVPALPRRGPPTLALTRGPTGLWGLHDCSVTRGPTLRPDFLDGALERRARMTWNMHEPLRDALGVSKGEAISVVDATAGMARDSWMMTAWGHSVRAWERHPLLAWMLRGAWEAAGAPPQLDLRHGDARTDREPARVVYLDPMYPGAKKSALPSGELQLLRRLLADDAPPDGLLPWALELATHRVIVKRPRGSEPLDGQRPSFQLEEASTRWDVYVRAGR